jgi:BirA family biotin operon repressor/biotin-[acetyl-CoA-carboxylase] ligase
VTSVPFSAWPARLHAACADCTLLRTAVALETTTSTQDAPETRSAHAGTLVTAWRQSSGRGRFGRNWADTATMGIAVTFVVDAQPAERLALAGAVAAAEAAESTLGARVGIKWPNDIVVGGRKLAGVLIETTSGRALIGIGMNIAQPRFEAELEDRATSLAMLGAHADRIEVLCALIGTLDRALLASDAALVEHFLARDALRGTRALFSTPAGPVEGEVRSVDPMRGLVVRTDSGEHFLPAHSTSVAEWGGRRGSSR